VVDRSLFSLAPGRKFFYFPRTAFISHISTLPLFAKHDISIAVMWTTMHNDEFYDTTIAVITPKNGFAS
jgi:hypothetical protein